MNKSTQKMRLTGRLQRYLRWPLWMILVLAGAALFWISDLLILFLYFYHTKHPAVHVANLLTYYYAMFLIAVSLAF